MKDCQGYLFPGSLARELVTCNIHYLIQSPLARFQDGGEGDRAVENGREGGFRDGIPMSDSVYFMDIYRIGDIDN